MPRPTLPPLLALLCAALLLAACAGAQPTQLRPRPTPPTDSAAPATPAQPSGLPSASVVRVIDGDTVDVRLEGQLVRLRLIGIDTPELKDPRRAVECFGQEASARAHALLDGQPVALEADPSQGESDRYGRTLRYLWLPDGRLFNLELIAQGYAFEYTYNLPYKYQATFQEAQRSAREQQRGLWSPSTCAGQHRPAGAAPASTTAASPSLPTLTAAPASVGRCDPAYPDVCIPPPPPDLDCADVPQRNFRVISPHPHHFDRDRDGVGCES